MDREEEEARRDWLDLVGCERLAGCAEQLNNLDEQAEPDTIEHGGEVFFTREYVIKTNQEWYEAGKRDGLREAQSAVAVADTPISRLARQKVTEYYKKRERKRLVEISALLLLVMAVVVIFMKG